MNNTLNLFLVLLALFCSGCAQHYNGFRITPATRADIPRFVAAVDRAGQRFHFHRIPHLEGVHQVQCVAGPSAGTCYEAETMRYFAEGFTASFDPRRRSLEVSASLSCPPSAHPPSQALRQRDVILSHIVQNVLTSFPDDRIFLWREEGRITRREGVPLRTQRIFLRSGG